MNIISKQNFSKSGPAENWRRFMKVKDNLDFAEVGVAQIGIFSKQTEFDTIDQSCSISPFFQ